MARHTGGGSHELQVRNEEFVCWHEGQDLKSWCDEHMLPAVRSGEDSKIFGPEMRVSIPIIPQRARYAIVKIGKELFDNGPAPLELLFTPEIGNTRTIELGLWTPGDGVLAMSEAVLEYIWGKSNPGDLDNGNLEVATQCPSPTHSPTRSAALAKGIKYGDYYKIQVLFDIALERACTVCLDEDAFSGSDDNFGINTDTVKQGGKKPWEKD